MRSKLIYFFLLCFLFLISCNPEIKNIKWIEYTTDNSNSPPPRSGHSLAYISNNRVLLFGGYNGNEYLQDTWVYDTNTHIWNEYTSFDLNPSVRSHSAMTYIGNGKLIMYGGKYFVENGGYDLMQDTWIFDIIGHTWTKISTESANPPARSDSAIAFVGDNKVILFGGEIENINMSNDTYEFDFVTKCWTKLSPKTSPTKRKNHSMAYIGDNIVLLFGGYGGYTSTQYMSDTWYYDLQEKNWYNISVNEKKPEKRKKHSISYGGGSKIVLFGGVSENEMLLSDTWECETEKLTDKMSYNSDVPILSADTSSLQFNDTLIDGTTELSFNLINSGTGGNYDPGNMIGAHFSENIKFFLDKWSAGAVTSSILHLVATPIMTVIMAIPFVGSTLVTPADVALMAIGTGFWAVTGCMGYLGYTSFSSIPDKWNTNFVGALNGGPSDGVIAVETAAGSNQYPADKVGGIPITDKNSLPEDGITFQDSHFHFPEAIHGGPVYTSTLLSRKESSKTIAWLTKMYVEKRNMERSNSNP